MKILLNIFIPSIGEDYDLLIPDSLPVGEIIPLLIEAIQEKTNKFYQSSGEEILNWEGTGLALDTSSTLAQYGIRNGDRVILI